MTRDILQERERGIENQWARQHDEELLRKLRERAKIREISEVLAKKLRVDDPALRQRILDLGVTRETGPALFFAPLVQIAWADGKVTDRERATILSLASLRGVAPGGPVHAQLLRWLRTPPPQALFDAALEVIRAGISVLPEAERRERVAGFAEAYRRVADSSRSGLHRVLDLRGAASPEKDLIARLTATLLG